MSPADHKTPAAQNERVAAVVQPDRLAHELANLLDGSLRNVGLVIGTLRDAGEGAGQAEALIHRLQAANESMNQMVRLIRGWVEGAHRTVDFEQDTRTVVEAVDHAVRLLTPAAESRGIQIQVVLADRVARLAAGPLYGVLANAIRNSIEAIDSVPADSGRRGGKIEVSVRLDDNHVELRVSDDGPGLSAQILGPDGRACPGKTTKPTGHGLGLQLCQDIAQGLAGTLELRNRPSSGAELILRYPLNRRG
jgi:signal transduction histidine kinase